jgi:glycyl-tRNA synthetase
MDAIGTPFCVTIDHDTLQNDTVTIRHRDTMKQDRVNISELKAVLEKACSMKELLKKI